MGNAKIAPKIVATKPPTKPRTCLPPKKPEKPEHPVLDLAAKLTEAGKSNRTLDKNEWQQLGHRFW
jgi:hypothetical protein